METEFQPRKSSWNREILSAAQARPKRSADVPVRSVLTSSKVVEVFHNPRHAQPLRTGTSALRKFAWSAKTLMHSSANYAETE
jgi:hypothetical protein